MESAVNGMKTFKIQHSTFNIEHPTACRLGSAGFQPASLLKNGHTPARCRRFQLWMPGAEGSMFNVPL
jgi:hypothetical protein